MDDYELALEFPKWTLSALKIEVHNRSIMKKGGTANIRPFIMILFLLLGGKMLELLLWVGMFVLIYLFYELFVIRKEKVLENMKEGKELSLLSKKYKLDYSKINMKELVRRIALANAFILSTVVSLVSLLQNWISNFLLWMVAVLVVGMLLLIPFILIVYSKIGRYYQKKQGGEK